MAIADQLRKKYLWILILVFVHSKSYLKYYWALSLKAVVVLCMLWEQICFPTWRHINFCLFIHGRN